MKDRQITHLQREVINAYLHGLDFDQFYEGITADGELPGSITVALIENGYGSIPEAASNVLWQTTLGLSDIGVLMLDRHSMDLKS